ncbi:hypothetical protein DPMN_027731 [Dreissena polymorpha]|uniref:Uncharacterized protein n=1 Tax=Dreissena polymorpha TaxID=45954 RepID=A0A9D4RDQ5_DREPO|nr:hypothetical protein DPMN_027731 [Dreissena polymorpha]
MDFLIRGGITMVSIIIQGETTLTIAFHRITEGYQTTQTVVLVAVTEGALVARTTGELSGEGVVLTEVVEETVEEEMVEVETVTLVTKTFWSKQDFGTFAGGVVIVIMKILLLIKVILRIKREL